MRGSCANDHEPSDFPVNRAFRFRIACQFRPEDHETSTFLEKGAWFSNSFKAGVKLSANFRYDNVFDSI